MRNLVLCTTVFFFVLISFRKSVTFTYVGSSLSKTRLSKYLQDILGERTSQNTEVVFLYLLPGCGPWEDTARTNSLETSHSRDSRKTDARLPSSKHHFLITSSLHFELGTRKNLGLPASSLCTRWIFPVEEPRLSNCIFPLHSEVRYSDTQCKKTMFLITQRG